MYMHSVRIGVTQQSLMNILQERMINMTKFTEEDRALWLKAREIAKEKYEEDTTEGAWEEADKYEREDYVWAAYERLKGEQK